MRMGPAPIADNGPMMKEVVATTRITTMHLIIRLLSTPSLPLKKFLAGCSKRAHRRTSQMECWSTGVMEYCALNASLHYSTTPILESSKCACISVAESEPLRCSPCNGQTDTWPPCHPG